ncbi:hypothetical protein MKW98_028186 [Papaver atlanticum]|uniref:tRNA synthetases class I catalytic domain-containing protein n=1 Tax=Papaver atlanticum TaxID=357466 RepID=A0AAD4XMK6_9MAGN|nr:hypothetical protein MKW98_028186 [Papaver atlanticum]
MSFIEHFQTSLESLPFMLQKKYGLMRDLDRSLHGSQHQNEQRCEQEIEYMERLVKSGNITPDTPLIKFSSEALNEQKHCIRVADEEILQNDYAYTADGDVYFSVDKFPAYGRLSGRKLEDNLAGGGGRTQDSLTSRKRNENDFALWKAAKLGEISWESPWGPGRPGWHIECSAMSYRYLTSSFDIHGGGMDLIFPHHENEIARAARPNTCEIKYWMHNGFVNVNKEKMSKSLGNLFTIREVTTSYHPLALRYFMMSTHYRSPVNYSLNQLETASDTVFYLYQTLLDCEEALFPIREKNPEVSVRKGKNIRITLEAQECINKLKNDFYAKMSDDLHTQDFLKGALQEILKLMNSSLNKLKKAKQQQQSLFLSLAEMEKEVKMVLDTLGLLSSLSYSGVLEQLKAEALTRANLTEEDVLQQIESRTQARRNSEFAKSDQIREDLKAKGIALMDLGNETIWRPCARNLETDAASTSGGTWISFWRRLKKFLYARVNGYPE